MMKKILAVLFVFLMSISLFAGCGTETPTLSIIDTEYAVEDYAIYFAKDNTLCAEVDAVLKELINDGTVKAIVDKYISGVENDLVFQQDVAEGAEELRMATNAEFPPYEYHEDGTIVGIDAEIAAAIADKLGKKLVIDDMDFTAILAAVESGKADFAMAGLTVTEERLESGQFSSTYATGIQVIITSSASRVKTMDDLFELGDVKIGVQENTTGDIYATGDIEDEGLGTISRFNKGADAVQALLTGKVDCVIIDNEPAKAFVEANNK